MELQFKVYTPQGVFKRQINSKNVYSQVEYQEELDGGQGDLTLRVLGSYSDFNVCDIIEIRSSTLGDLYTGIIEQIKITEYEKNNILDIKLYGIFTILNDVLCNSGTKNGTVGSVVKGIIDNFNSKYGALQDTQILQGYAIRYTADSIDDSGSQTDIYIKPGNSLDAIKQAIKDTNYYFFIGCDGVCYLQKRDNIQDVRYLTFQKEIIKIEKTIDKKELTNKSYMTNDSGVSSVLQDDNYIAIFGLRETRTVNTGIGNQATCDTRNQAFLDSNKNPTFDVTMTVKKGTKLKPGQFVTTLNTKQKLNNFLVKKVQNKANQVVAVFGEVKSLGKTIVDLTEKE